MKVFIRILRLLRPHARALIFGMFCMLLSTGAMLAQPLLWMTMFDDVLTARQYARFWPVLGTMIAIGVVGAAAAGWRSWLLERTAQRFVMDLRERIYGHLQAQSLAFFHERRTGDLLARVVGDVDTLQEVVINGTDSILSNLLSMTGVAVVLIFLNWKLGLLTVLPVLVTFSLMKRYNRLVKPVYRAARDRLGDVSAKLQENLTGVHTVKAFAREDLAAERFKTAITAYFQQSLLGVSMRTRYMPAVQFISFIGSVVMIGYGAYLVQNENMSIGVLVACSRYWWQLYGPVYSIAGINDLVQRANASGGRIFELLDRESELRDAPDAKALPRIRGEVVFENVSFSYRAELAGKAGTVAGTSPVNASREEIGFRVSGFGSAGFDSNNPKPETRNPELPGSSGHSGVLRNVTLRVPPGTRVGLVGPSGAGKSTMLALIPRFFDPQRGRITIDGFDLREVTQASLRRQIGMVLQESFLFNDTILENIRFGRPAAPMEDVERAARESNAHEFIVRLPNGYETLVGERGVKLSGGQRQRIAIARAFLADPEILLLDEATSAVEPESETIIQQALERLMAGRTTFIVSHRLSVIRPCEVIVAMEHGAIVEQGTHQELLERGGLYAQMYRMQMGEEAVEMQN